MFIWKRGSAGSKAIPRAFSESLICLLGCFNQTHDCLFRAMEDGCSYLFPVMKEWLLYIRWTGHAATSIIAYCKSLPLCIGRSLVCSRIPPLLIFSLITVSKTIVQQRAISEQKPWILCCCTLSFKGKTCPLGTVSMAIHCLGPVTNFSSSDEVGREIDGHTWSSLPLVGRVLCLSGSPPPLHSFIEHMASHGK